MSAVTCLTWVPRGSAKPIPEKIEFNPKEFKEYVDISVKPETSNESLPEAAENNDVENDESMAKYNLDDYDDEEEIGIDMETAFNEMQSNDNDDPYLDLDDDEFDDYEKRCYEIKADDNLLIVGHAEEESGLLAIYVYNEDDNDLYVHHDILLPHMPLSVEWIGCNPTDGSPGNFAAVGTINSEISMWNLDVVDALYPDLIFERKIKKEKKRSEKESYSSEGHTDSVLSISWNKIVKNVFASASADCSICVWDLFGQGLLHKINYHTATVQSVQWHSSEPQFLLSGATDGTVCLFDCRTPDEASMIWKINGEIEKVLWNRFNPYYFVCSTDLGFVHIMDCREKGVIYSFEAHEDAATGLTMLCKDPNTLITTSADQSVKVWDIHEKPTLVANRKLELGIIFAVQGCPDSEFLIALGGDNRANNLSVQNIKDF